MVTMPDIWGQRGGLAVLLILLLPGVLCNEGHHHHGEPAKEGVPGKDDDLATLIKSFGLAVLGKDQENANDIQPTEDHAHLNVQAIIDELFHPSTKPPPTSTSAPLTTTASGPLPLQHHHIDWEAGPLKEVSNNILEPLHSRQAKHLGHTTVKPVYLTETNYFLARDEAGREHFSPLQFGREGKSLELSLDVTQLIDKPTIPVVDIRLANFLVVNGGKRKRKRNQRNKIHAERQGKRLREENHMHAPALESLKFKQATPAPFQVPFELENELEGSEEANELHQKHEHEKERSGEVGAWEEDGTLWRSHDPHPSEGQISDHGMPGLSAATQELEESFVQKQISRQQKEALRRAKDRSVPTKHLSAPHKQSAAKPRTSPSLQRKANSNSPSTDVKKLEGSFVQSKIRRQQEEALRRAEIIQSQEEEVEEAGAVQPLMQLVEAIFSLPQQRQQKQTRVPGGVTPQSRDSSTPARAVAVSRPVNPPSGKGRSEGRRGGRTKGKNGRVSERKRPGRTGGRPRLGKEEESNTTTLKQTQLRTTPGVPPKLAAPSPFTAMMRRHKHGQRDCQGDGLHADIHSGCQDFYMCHAGKRAGHFSCPGGTLFSDELRVCDWRGKVGCNPQAP